jgi:hypothetical protein
MKKATLWQAAAFAMGVFLTLTDNMTAAASWFAAVIVIAAVSSLASEQ